MIRKMRWNDSHPLDTDGAESTSSPHHRHQNAAFCAEISLPHPILFHFNCLHLLQDRAGVISKVRQKVQQRFFWLLKNLSLREGQGQKLIASDQWPKTFIVSFYYGPVLMSLHRAVNRFLSSGRAEEELYNTFLIVKESVVECWEEIWPRRGTSIAIATWIELRPFWTTEHKRKTVRQAATMCLSWCLVGSSRWRLRIFINWKMSIIDNW